MKAEDFYNPKTDTFNFVLDLILILTASAMLGAGILVLITLIFA